ncbi:hypothetical protein NMY22_g19239 [Coprinellus aureogranulatus]|nr:hypothetical protein NMY22_g19239 [Coprinellus aureogranulatus]
MIGVRMQKILRESSKRGTGTGPRFHGMEGAEGVATSVTRRRPGVKPANNPTPPASSTPRHQREQCQRLPVAREGDRRYLPRVSTLVHSQTKLPHFIANALHRTELHSADTFTALILLQWLKARLLTAQGSFSHHEGVCKDTYPNKGIVAQGMFSLSEIYQMEQEMRSYLDRELTVDNLILNLLSQLPPRLHLKMLCGFDHCDSRLRNCPSPSLRSQHWPSVIAKHPPPLVRIPLITTIARQHRQTREGHAATTHSMSAPVPHWGTTGWRGRCAITWTGVSPSHLKLQLEEHYWTHVGEHHSMHGLGLHNNTHYRHLLNDRLLRYRFRLQKYVQQVDTFLVSRSFIPTRRLAQQFIITPMLVKKKFPFSIPFPARSTSDLVDEAPAISACKQGNQYRHLNLPAHPRPLHDPLCSLTPRSPPYTNGQRQIGRPGTEGLGALVYLRGEKGNGRMREALGWPGKVGALGRAFRTSTGEFCNPGLGLMTSADVPPRGCRRCVPSARATARLAYSASRSLGVVDALLSASSLAPLALPLVLPAFWYAIWPAGVQVREGDVEGGGRWSECLDDEERWQGTLIIREDTFNCDLDKEDRKRFHYQASAEGKTAAKAMGNLIDFDDEWRSKAEQDESEYTRLRPDAADKESLDRGPVDRLRRSVSWFHDEYKRRRTTISASAITSRSDPTHHHRDHRSPNALHLSLSPLSLVNKGIFSGSHLLSQLPPRLCFKTVPARAVASTTATPVPEPSVTTAVIPTFPTLARIIAKHTPPLTQTPPILTLPHRSSMSSIVDTSLPFPRMLAQQQAVVHLDAHTLAMTSCPAHSLSANAPGPDHYGQELSHGSPILESQDSELGWESTVASALRMSTPPVPLTHRLLALNVNPSVRPSTDADERCTHAVSSTILRSNEIQKRDCRRPRKRQTTRRIRADCVRDT